MTDAELQADELLALTSIYDDTVITVSDDGDEPGGQFIANLHLPENVTIKISHRKDKKDVDSKEEIHTLKYLPPVILNFQFPVDYPSSCPPTFTLSCKWLNRKQLTLLCEKLDKIWEENEGCEILFMWTNFLSEESLEFLGLHSPIDFSAFDGKKNSNLDTRAIQDVVSRDHLLPALLDYNKQEKLRQFEKSVYQCKVCFADKFGSVCISFHECDHVYCKECMKDYFMVQIQDGNVMALSCPEDKCESQAHPSQVKELVSQDLFDKYDRLLLQTSLDKMADVMYCPRPSCQYPVMRDLDSNMGSCPNCSYVFCTLCKLVYHGLSPCRLKSAGLKELRDEYIAANEAEKKFLEKKFGKRTIEQALEEVYSNEWLENFSKACPVCGTHIQKIDGCNKMTCIKCRTYFCWICMMTLSRNNPYRHYNSLDSPCHNKLFEGVEMDYYDDDDEIDEDLGLIVPF